MIRIRCDFSKILGIFLFFILIPLAASMAAPAPSPELESVLQKIEARHYRWIAIRADVILFFATSGNSRAMCGGELLYQRLDERMLLTCVDSKKNLVFAFRTLDRRFDLYLPSQNTLYHGSIFDMEDSPEIESHLKPRDLYRALKPSAIDPQHIEIGRSNLIATNLDVYAMKDNKEYLSRKLYLTPEGDVRGELYLNPEGRSVTEIQRYDFQRFRAPASAFQSIVFPKKITILSPETKKGSAIFFAKVTALDAVDPLEFLFRVPLGTQEVFLEEKDPRLAMRQLSTGEKIAILSKENPAGKKSAFSVLEKSEKVAPKKIAKTVKMQENIVGKPAAAVKEKPDAHRNADKEPADDHSQDADIAPENSAESSDDSAATSPATPSVPTTEDPNTSLDPSVPPSTDLLEAVPEPEGPIVKYPKQEKNTSSDKDASSKN